MFNARQINDTRRRALEQAAWDNLQDEARIASELQRQYGISRTEALRAAYEMKRGRHV